MSTTSLQHQKQYRMQVARGTNVISDDETESQTVAAHDDTSNIVCNASDGSEMLPTYPSIAYLNPDLCINAPTVVDEEEPKFPITSSGVHDRRSSPTSFGYTDGSYRASVTASPPDVVVVTSPSGVSAPEPDVAMEAPIPRTSTYDDRGDVQLFAHPFPSLNAQPHFAPLAMSLGSRSHASSRWTWKRRPFRRTIEVTWFRLAVFVIILAVLLTTAALLGMYCSRDDASTKSQPQGGEAPGTPSVSTLDSIKARGSLVCGVVANSGFSMFNETTQTWSGFDVDLCRAIGAAAFNYSGDHVIFKNLILAERFIALQNGEVDVLAAQTTYTMERDLYEPQFVDCADRLSSSGNCSNLQICVHDGTTHVGIVKDLFPGSVIKLAPSPVDFYNNFVQGHCNVLASEQFDLAAINVRQAGYSGNYSISNSLYSKEPLALVTRDDDAGWSDLVNWVVLALLSAENKTITQQIAQSAIANPTITVEDSLLWSYHAVAAVGNYAELYDRHLQSLVPRAPVNQQNSGTTPLIYSFPLGNNTIVGPGPIANGTLARILQRGYLLCGTAEVAFFAGFNKSTQEWTGYDVDYCRAVSAAIFNGMGSTVFVPITATNRWERLAKGEIDLISWDTTWNYERDVYEPSTRVGFSFTTPTFYTGLQLGGIPSYTDCADNLDVTSPPCKNLTICVNNGTTYVEILRRLFKTAFIIPQATYEEVYECLNSSEGNVIAEESLFLTASTTLQKYYSGNYKVGTKVFSRENLAIVTRQDDPQWSSFVNWVVMATFYAQEKNITQASYKSMESMPTTNLFGQGFLTMFKDAIQAVGSHFEILVRNAGKNYHINPTNQLNKNQFGPQHFPPGNLFHLD